MFNDVGSKCKAAAKVLCWIGIVSSVISGIALMLIAAKNTMLGIYGILVIVFGSLFSWLLSLVFYGFGELVDNSDIRTNLAIKADMESQTDGSQNNSDEFDMFDVNS